MSIDQPQPGGRRILPDFLKRGDPALTFPHGKAYGVNHPKGVPNLPGPITPNELARDWLAHVAAGRIGRSRVRRTCPLWKSCNHCPKYVAMVDNRTKDSRSRLMSRIGSKHTKPELIVRSLLHRVGYRFRLHRKELPGRPDIVFIGRKKAILVHGCFWHGHGCKIGKLPKSNLEFWSPKIERNRARDREKRSELEQVGWTVDEVWQCETKDIQVLEVRLRQFLDSPKTIDSA